MKSISVDVCKCVLLCMSVTAGVRCKGEIDSNKEFQGKNTIRNLTTVWGACNGCLQSTHTNLSSHTGRRNKQIIIIIINLIYIAQFDTNGILTALYIVMTYIQMQYVHVCTYAEQSYKYTYTCLHIHTYTVTCTNIHLPTY